MKSVPKYSHISELSKEVCTVVHNDSLKTVFFYYWYIFGSYFFKRYLHSTMNSSQSITKESLSSCCIFDIQEIECINGKKRNQLSKYRNSSFFHQNSVPARERNRIAAGDLVFFLVLFLCFYNPFCGIEPFQAKNVTASRKKKSFLSS